MSRVGIKRVVLALVAWAGLSGLALADDWMVDRLRGEVLVNVDGSWSPLQRGDVVSGSSRIRSAEGSRVTFTRGAEAIELDGATEIRIFDQQCQRMTTIMQAYGTVTVEAERLQIQHFSVQTPFLAAIVKGTRFTVTSDDAQSSVDVSRGLVQVQDYAHGVATDITPGQTAVVSNEVALAVSGRGPHKPMVTLDGKVLPPAAQAAGEAGRPGNNGNGQGNGQGNGNGNSNNRNSGNAAGGQGNGNGNSAGGNSGGSSNSDSGQGHGSGAGNGDAASGHTMSSVGNGSSGNGNSGSNGDSGHGNSDKGNGSPT